MYIKDSKTGDVYIININCLRGNNWQPDISSDLLCDDHMTIKDAQEYIMCLEKDIEDINPNYLTGLTFHYCKTMMEALKIALV